MCASHTLTRTPLGHTPLCLCRSHSHTQIFDEYDDEVAAAEEAESAGPKPDEAKVWSESEV
jgi:hypothetical protein